jgi:DNA-binding PadR family transcriptional regulator
MAFRPSDALLPLTPIAFEILMTLVDEPRHGYAILQAVEGRLAPTLPLRTGTLYRSLARLLEQRLIEEVPSPAGTDERRRAYALTALGRETLRADAARLADQVEAARQRRLIPGGRR